MATSTGRGGAGNITDKSNIPPPDSASLATPHIKSDMYTTGRGGTGNMATNLPSAPEYARAAQDVAGPDPGAPGAPVRDDARLHQGRGGGGNFGRAPSREQGDEGARERLRQEATAAAPRAEGGEKAPRGSGGILEGGKKLLERMRGGKKGAEQGSEAVKE